MMILSLILWGLCIIASIESRQIDLFHNLTLNAPVRHVYIKANGLATVQHKGNLGIVNGKPAAEGQFCYTVYLQFTDETDIWACTGSLVTNKVILTAAHCLDGAQRGAVIAGVTDLKKTRRSNLMFFPRSSMKIHEKYNEQAQNDLGTITLEKGFELNKNVCTVKLPASSSNQQQVKESDNDTVSGWGKTSDRTTTTALMYMEVPELNHSACAGYYKDVARYSLIESQMCTSGAGGKSTCNGDSGGPLVKDGVQQGIVSLGISTCEAGAPSVYTNLNYFMSWLHPIINKE